MAVSGILKTSDALINNKHYGMKEENGKVVKKMVRTPEERLQMLTRQIRGLEGNAQRYKVERTANEMSASMKSTVALPRVPEEAKGQTKCLF